MKIKSFVILLLIIYTDNLYGYASNPPNGRTGAPGETTCATSSCHNSYPLNSGSGDVMISGPSEYTPGEILTFVVNVSHTGQSRWGFELCTRTDGLDQGGEIMVTDPTYTQSSTGAGITNLKQTSSGTFNGQSNEAQWEFEWQGPEEGTGPITIYAVGNAANGNNNRLGDYIYSTEFTVLGGSGEVLPVDYYSQIEPIFTDANCANGYCHGNGASGLYLDSYEGLMAGGNHGLSVIPSDAENSILVQKISPDPPFGDRMPDGNPTYFDSHMDEFQLIVDWINEGAYEYPETDECVPNGDVNMDGGLNVLDIVSTVGFILGQIEFTDEQFCSGDVNEDGQINILDIVVIVNLILNP